ncbi:hypothetical protein OsJ_07389 [Oryza sativa Japonica Group]|jgi:hypothetical protein|uniref:Uncharacterized protein n=1 Tax=Oryza sativa subsp. japonica TaxID=39947 RepID=A3A8P8_ORYSJ|nr:hypothetical protein OsJ_07389 [Oryza sativa Japonica Group]
MGERRTETNHEASVLVDLLIQLRENHASNASSNNITGTGSEEHEKRGPDRGKQEPTKTQGAARFSEDKNERNRDTKHSKQTNTTTNGARSKKSREKNLTALSEKK